MTYGIKCWIDVAEPKGESETPRLDVAWWTHGRQQIEEEEGQPAGNKCTHDQAQN